MILIPAYNPPASFDTLVEALVEVTKDTDIPLVIVDDGSDESQSQDVLNSLAQTPGVTLLRHPTNLGKGAALKTGIEYASQIMAPFVVTADADGQHLPNDILRIVECAKTHDKLIIGTRLFSGHVPARSLFGNAITRLVFFIATGRNLADTQSGLRSIPRQLFNEFLGISANKYDFELHCLLKAAEKRMLTAVEIQTVYEAGNPTSHFRPLLDSMLIYAVFLRYSLAALLIAALDFSCFLLLSAVLSDTPTAFLFTRLVTVPLYFFVMKDIVFRGHASNFWAMAKYLILASANVLFGTQILQLVDPSNSLQSMLAYLAINVCAAIFNFLVMKYVIFLRHNH
jgi:glycosyltransferase involved in cell wall biosynthesis